MENEWIQYYCREKRYTAMYLAAQKAGNDPVWTLYQGLALVLSRKLTEGITTLSTLISHLEVSLAAQHISLIAHSLCEVVDREAVSQLEWQIKDETKNAGELSLYYAALCLLHCGKHDKSREYVEKLLQDNDSSCGGLIVKGWLELASGKKKNAAQAFKAALVQDKLNMDAILGEVTTLSPEEAVSHLNQLVVRYPKATPPLIEKMKLQLAMQDWGLTLDTANRILSLDSNCTAALQIKALHQIVVNGMYEEGVLSLHRFLEELLKQEPSSVQAHLAAARLFSRVCGRCPSVLSETIQFMEKAVNLSSQRPDSLLEFADQYRLNNKLTEASKLYKAVTKLDNSSISALTGLTRVQLAQNGPSEQVQQQVEFLVEVSGSEVTSELLLLRAQFEIKDCMKLLNQAVDIRLQAASMRLYGTDYLTDLNPDLLVEISKVYPDSTQGMKKKVAILQRIVESCPGLIVALILLAQSQAASGNYTSAVELLKNLLNNIDPSNIDAYLALARIHIAQEKFDEAKMYLEQGLSCNLQAQEEPVYHVLLGCVQHHNNNNIDCIKSLRTALAINKGNKLSMTELGILYQELSSSLLASGETEEAGRVLNDAMKVLKGTEQEARLTIASAELASARGDYNMALTLLASIMPDQPYYIQACKQMADIHLHKLKDGQAFAECYKKLVESKHTTENLIMLGDAYMTIQEAELAVETYEQAMKHSSGNPKLLCRLGHVLVRTHQYGKAIKCYRDAGQEGSTELAKLLLRLGQLDIAETTLKNVPLSDRVLILAKVKEKAGDIQGALRVIQEAHEEAGNSDSKLCAQFCIQMAEYCSALRDYDSAITHYKKSLFYQPNDSCVQISLAKLYMQVNDWSACQALCSSLLSRNADNEPALLMLADLAYRRVDFVDAAVHFSELLTRHPDYWVALARLIEVKRRTAQLEDAKPFLEAAALIAANEPGFSYCAGLYDWYSGKVNSALHHFNCARHDSEWGQQALHNMVELCLAGDDGISTATRLLTQMKAHSPDEEINIRLLHNLVLLSSKDKQDIEIAMADLTNLASNDTLRIGAILGLATGYVLQKQIPRARNVLKRIAKAAWLVEEAEYLERCWLLLADLHIQGGKYEPASELLRRVLMHNQSCHRAYELLGLIAEKEQKYLEAGSHYQQAWKMSGESDPALGYKLGFNLVKAKRYANAISVCRAVLKINPDYPRIRKEILDKAIAHLRT